MTTMLLLLASALLIGTGLGLIWRDVLGKRRDAFVLSRDSSGTAALESDVEIAVSRPPASAPLAMARGGMHEPQEASLGGKLRSLAGTGASAEAGLLRPDAGRPSATALQWATLQPVISTAVEQVNSVLAGAGVAIGTQGEPSLGSNKAYGSERRILVAGKSLALLRLECTPGGRLKASVTADDETLADQINGDASTLASRADIARVSDLLSECLKPVASYAVGSAGDAERRVSEADWNTTEAIVVAALKAGNGALSQAGARLVPLATPAWDAQLKRHRMPVAVQVFGNDVARMHIDRLEQEVEVAVGVPDARLADLARRQRMPLQGMTMHALAEMIAGCAWPAIAHYRETHPRA
jgi:hypothetical protein